MTTDSIDIVPFSPEFPTPKLLFHFWVKLEKLFGNDTFDSLYYGAWTHRWNTLNQKVNMIFVGPYFNELYLIPLRYLKADLFQRLVNGFAEYNPAIFRWAYKMVEKH